jgi:hypothetical protein
MDLDSDEEKYSTSEDTVDDDQRRHVCSARGVTRTVLFKCDVALCVDRSYFEDYHTKNDFKTSFHSFSMETVGASTTM